MTASPLAHGAALSPAELRAAWEPTKQRLVQEARENDLRVRIHRACGALEEAQALEQAERRSSVDTALVLRWVALNSLYGRWDEGRGYPLQDRRALDLFTSECARHDRPRVAALFDSVREPAEALVENPFLAERFWRDGDLDDLRPRSGQVRRMAGAAREGRVGAALHQVLIVVYFLRCQLVHGGATLGGRLNRATVDPAAEVLRLAAPQLTALAIERGLEMEWGELCYPPV